jgi:hypothetical protein
MLIEVGMFDRPFVERRRFVTVGRFARAPVLSEI